MAILAATWTGNRSSVRHCRTAARREGGIIPDSHDTLVADVEIRDRDVPAAALVERIVVSTEPETKFEPARTGLSEACRTHSLTQIPRNLLENMRNQRSGRKGIRV